MLIIEDSYDIWLNHAGNKIEKLIKSIRIFDKSVYFEPSQINC